MITKDGYNNLTLVLREYNIEGARRVTANISLIIDMPQKLNIGCGADIKHGWINLDAVALPGVDVVHDITILPLPFRDGAFDEILCQDVLEHVAYAPLLRDIHRILRPGGLLFIRVPHFTSKNNFVDPTHIRMFSVNTWDFFAAETPTYNKRIARERAYYFDFIFDRVAMRRITFEHGSRIFWYNRVMERLVNLSPRMQEIYESTFLCSAFPAQDILIALVKKATDTTPHIAQSAAPRS